MLSSCSLWFCCLLNASLPRRWSGGSAKAVVLQKNEGELRTRRPREIASPSSDFMLKIGPKTNGSKHLLLFTEKVLPGRVIPRHKHHGEDEILLIQTAAPTYGWATKSTTRSPERWYSFPLRLGSA